MLIFAPFLGFTLAADRDVGGLDQGRDLVAYLKLHVVHRARGDDGGHIADGSLHDDLTQHLVRDNLLYRAGYFVANRLFHTNTLLIHLDYATGTQISCEESEA